MGHVATGSQITKEAVAEKVRIGSKISVSVNRRQFSEAFTGVKVVSDHKELMDVFRFRYRTYVLAMKRDWSKADHLNQMYFDDLDKNAVHISAFDKGKVVGSMRINFECYENLPEDNLYDYQRFDRKGARCLVSKAMVAPEYRGSSTFMKMCARGVEECLQRKATLLFMATADGLVPLFEKMGFVGYRHFDSWADYGSSNPMTLDLDKMDYLAEIRSPLLRVVERFYEKSIFKQAI